MSLQTDLLLYPHNAERQEMKRRISGILPLDIEYLRYKYIIDDIVWYHAVVLL